LSQPRSNADWFESARGMTVCLKSLRDEFAGLPSFDPDVSCGDDREAGVSSLSQCERGNYVEKSERAVWSLTVCGSAR